MRAVPISCVVVGLLSLTAMAQERGPAAKRVSKLPQEGIWAVTLKTGEAKLLFPSRNFAVMSPDCRLVAELGASEEVIERLSKAGKHREAHAARQSVTVGPPGGARRVAWTWPLRPREGMDFKKRAEYVQKYGRLPFEGAPGTVLAAPGGLRVWYPIEWSPGGRRLLLSYHKAQVVVDVGGKRKATRVSGAACWIGRTDGKLLVLNHSKRGKDVDFAALDVETGARTRLLPSPPGSQHVDPLNGAITLTVAAADDLRTIAVFIQAAMPESELVRRLAGVWVWRKGQRAYVRLGDGNARSGALSRNGKFIVALIARGEHTKQTFETAMWDAATRKVLWTTGRQSPYGRSKPVYRPLRFSRRSTRLALVGRDELSVTPCGVAAPRSACQMPGLVRNLVWSHDEEQIYFRFTRVSPRTIIHVP